jgi:hypothetical protein
VCSTQKARPATQEMLTAPPTVPAKTSAELHAEECDRTVEEIHANKSGFSTAGRF